MSYCGTGENSVDKLLANAIVYNRHQDLLIFLQYLQQVQLQLLTAIVKLFLKKPTDTQELVQQVLTLATQVQDCKSIILM